MRTGLVALHPALRRNINRACGYQPPIDLVARRLAGQAGEFRKYGVGIAEYACGTSPGMRCLAIWSYLSELMRFLRFLEDRWTIFLASQIADSRRSP
jgi:hypothetical protein